MSTFGIMLLVNDDDDDDDDDVGFSLVFFVQLCYVLYFLIFLFYFILTFIFVCVCVWVCAWLISTVWIHIVTIGDQLDELGSFSGSLPHVCLY